MNLLVKKLRPQASVPKFATTGSACFDLVAESVESEDDQWGPWVCKTGLAFEIPAGYVMLIYSRSGHGFKHGLRLANCVGVIDADYRGEVVLKLTKDSGDDYSPRCGERVAQAMLIRLPEYEITEVAQLSDTSRGAGGFGSTGAV